MDLNTDDRKAVLNTFLNESGERLSDMEESLVSLEASPDDREILDRIFRAVHTLKGNALSLGFKDLGNFIHGVENLLQKIRSQTIPVTDYGVTLLLQVVDVLKQMIPDAAARILELQPFHLDLLKQLEEAGREESPAQGADPPRKENPGGAGDKRKRPWGRRREDIHELIDRSRSIRVDIDKLDRLLNLMGEILLSHEKIKEELKRRETAQRKSQIDILYLASEPILMDLQDQIMKLRMVPAGPTLRQYIRIVRDLAKSSGKIARLTIEGEDVEIDSTIIESLKDPLMHMIRNAVDHGLETPEKRKAMGKNPCGQILLKVFHDAGNIVLQIEDDGGGLRKEAIRQKGVSLGLISEGARWSDAQIFNLIFENGFSTAEKITDLSGRGVGMDVVRQNIHSLRGVIEISSEENRGSVFTVRLPLTLAIINGFGVRLGEEMYVLPMEAVVECIDIMNRKEIVPKTGKGLFLLRGKALPYIRLRELFGLEGSPPERESIVIIQHHGSTAGLVVDAVIGEVQAVVKPLGDLFKEMPGISGSTISGNGRVGLIIDVASFLKLIEQKERLARAT
ncbi:MAG: chemotaxis protein CheA [Nitrospirae bacterium]|nr:chemotaxis protein CheA [Nitrospirota bacterium]MBI3605860.1 chemotaxis protein CheA [Nitrospirota bacterium]